MQTHQCSNKLFLSFGEWDSPCLTGGHGMDQSWTAPLSISGVCFLWLLCCQTTQDVFPFLL